MPGPVQLGPQRGQHRVPLPALGQRPGQLGADLADQVTERPQGPRRAQVVAMAAQQAPVRWQQPPQRPDQARLTDAGLAGDEHQPALAGHRLLGGQGELGELALTFEKHRPGHIASIAGDLTRDHGSADLIIHQTGLDPTRSVSTGRRSAPECVNVLVTWGNSAPRGSRPQTARSVGWCSASSGRLQTDLACSRWEPRRSRRVLSDRLDDQARQARSLGRGQARRQILGLVPCPQGAAGGSMLSEADQDGRMPTGPRPADGRGPAQQHPRAGAPFGGEALAVLHAEIASRDGRPRRGDLALGQVGHPAHLHAPERPHGLKDSTAGAGASSSDRTGSTQAWLTVGSLVESNRRAGKGQLTRSPDPSPGLYVHHVRLSAVCPAQVRGRVQPDRRSYGRGQRADEHRLDG